MTSLSTKKHGPNPSQKISHSLKEILWNSTLQRKKDLKKNCYVCGKLGHLKRNCPKKTIKMSEKWIEMIEEPETTTGINHENLSWTTCSNDQCGIHRSFKNTLNGIQKNNNIWEETKYVKQILPNENTSHRGNDDQY